MVSLQDWGPLRQKLNFKRSSETEKLFQRIFSPNVAVRTAIYNGKIVTISIGHGVKMHLLPGYRTHRGAACPKSVCNWGDVPNTAVDSLLIQRWRAFCP